MQPSAATLRRRHRPGRAEKILLAARKLREAAGTLTGIAVLAIGAADAATGEADDGLRHTGLIKLTVNEVRRLINIFIIRPISDLAHRLHWSQFRRRHQARARRSHYTRRLNPGLQP
ncbi:hypothetical protein ABZ807_21275 [Micromonospora sp. NPDC047548]|uniref:hypothetical protein n=1 Tax=Micromonospora sp. NPDC047548 TaxID=3155624 RepID=UPI0033C1191D